MDKKNYTLLPAKHGKKRKFIKKDTRDNSWWGKTPQRKMLKLLAYWEHCSRVGGTGEVAVSLNGHFTKLHQNNLCNLLRKIQFVPNY